MIDHNNELIVTYPSIVNKGLAVRLHILTILDWIDRNDPSHRDDSYYVMIDGTGAFDFSNIFLVIDKLCGIPRYDVVLGKRPDDNSGMAEWRKDIELFEEYVMAKSLDISRLSALNDHEEFPDSQAGCWGLRLSVMKDISLTARSYELEFDLLTSSIKSSLKIGFTDPLKMRQRCATDFGKEIDDDSMRQCLSKMEFIAHKLNLAKSDIPRLLDEYLDEKGGEPHHTLPDRYVKEMSNFGLHYDCY